MERIIKVLLLLSLLFLTGCSLGESAGSTAPDLAATDYTQDDLVLLTLPVHGQPNPNSTCNRDSHQNPEGSLSPCSNQYGRTNPWPRLVETPTSCIDHQ